jgi:hypothetical protein
MTLWPVDDDFTVEFMKEFYRRALQSGKAPSDLAMVQREKLKELRIEASLWKAVQLAGAFVMNSQGPVN